MRYYRYRDGLFEDINKAVKNANELKFREDPMMFWSFVEYYMDNISTPAEMADAIADYLFDNKALQSLYEDMEFEMDQRKLKKIGDSYIGIEEVKQ